jgi:hypothetical protein
MTWLKDFQVTPELRLVLAALGQSLGGRLPSPDLLKKIADQYRDAVPGHRVEIEHVPKGVLSPRKAFYCISIIGKQVDARWNLTPGHLAELVQNVSA